MRRIVIFSIFILLSIVLLTKTVLDSGDLEEKKSIAFIQLSQVDDKTFEGFKTQMELLGWSDKKVQYIVPGAAQKVKNLPGIVEKVLEKKPDLIFVSSTPATQAVKKAIEGRNIPVVFCPVNDPVKSNIVKNQNMPEGSITGVRLPTADGKRLEWIKYIVPDVKNILVPYSANDLSALKSLESISAVSKELDINLIKIPLKPDDKLSEIFSSVKSSVDAIYLPRDSQIEVRIDQFVHYADSRKIPLCTPSYQQVEKGALFTYGFIHRELGKDAAKMADLILKGVNPSDLPIKFGESYLVINKKTAQKIGLELSKEVLNRAHMVIEK
jgi:putative ABC transport system substrate-binding protein